MERVGLLGGTFDPVHAGHLQLAQTARDELQLDRVLLIPAAGPPHKCSVEVTSFRHRREMLLLALQGAEGLEPCFVEGELPVPSYTIDTVQWLQSCHGNLVEYYFIIGVDAFADLLSWKAYRELLRRVTLIVARRRGFTDNDRLREIAESLGYSRSSTRWTSARGLCDIYFLQSIPPEISSSHIRTQLAAGSTAVEGVHPLVLRYAARHQLYVSGRTASGTKGCHQG